MWLDILVKESQFFQFRQAPLPQYPRTVFVYPFVGISIGFVALQRPVRGGKRQESKERLRVVLLLSPGIVSRSVAEVSKEIVGIVLCRKETIIIVVRGIALPTSLQLSSSTSPYLITYISTFSPSSV